ncbi:ribonuclease J [Thermodesulfobium sp.]
MPLGGIEEIGRNMTLIESERSLIILDCGIKFPDPSFESSLLTADFQYVIDKWNKVKALFITHGHEDHIGAIPFLLKKINIPIYGTKLTLGMVRAKLKDYKISSKDIVFHEINSNEIIFVDDMFVESFHVNHSIPDGVGYAIHTPHGTIIHSGDFKFDQTPIDKKITEYNKLVSISSKGIDLLMLDITNVEREGFTPSEKVVGEKFYDVFRKVNGRIILTTFASNIHRIQQAINASIAFNRKFCILGKSMVNTVLIAKELGYLSFPEEYLLKQHELKNHPLEKTVIITTGSQGEPLSVLTRIANNNHKDVKIFPNDTVIISASPIPGNETLVNKTINKLFKLGAEVLYEPNYKVHVSGHGSKEDIKLLINLVKPKNLLPFHGEFRHMKHFSDLAQNLNYSTENIILAKNGTVVELNNGEVKIVDEIPIRNMIASGSEIIEFNKSSFLERKRISEDGLILISLIFDSEKFKILNSPKIKTIGLNSHENMLQKEIESAIYSFFLKSQKIENTEKLEDKISNSIKDLVFAQYRKYPAVFVHAMSLNER